ncbi:MAG TPA: M48 family peptidase [Bryobacteraceae bacterium]|nr:M48 family peptidase [Bryobacteraceae bacterium]
MQVIQLNLFGQDGGVAGQGPRFEETPAEIFTRVYRQKAIRSRRHPRGVTAAVAYRPWANANGRVRLDGEVLRVHLSDLWRTAPAEVLEALAEILVSKLFCRQASAEFSDRYREWVNTEEIHGEMVRLRRERGRKSFAPPQGEKFDLDLLFDQINAAYFNGTLAKPKLGWSLSASSSLLGHYDPPHHAIVLNRILDSAQMHPLLVEFVLYHEMLHILHPIELSAGRRHIHTRVFRAAEKLFKGYEEAKRLIRQGQWRQS